MTKIKIFLALALSLGILQQFTTQVKADEVQQDLSQEQKVEVECYVDAYGATYCKVVGEQEQEAHQYVQTDDDDHITYIVNDNGEVVPVKEHTPVDTATDLRTSLAMALTMAMGGLATLLKLKNRA